MNIIIIPYIQTSLGITPVDRDDIRSPTVTEITLSSPELNQICNDCCVVKRLKCRTMN